MTISIAELIHNEMMYKFGRIFLTLVVGYISLKIIHQSIDLFFSNLQSKSEKATRKNRLQTLKKALKNISTISLFILLFLLVASDLGFNIIPLLTGAGIAGIALSLGAQKMVQDLIAGFFLIVDNNVNIGDHVEIDKEKGSVGVVENITLRIVELRDAKGNQIFIPASEVKTVIVKK